LPVAKMLPLEMTPPRAMAAAGGAAAAAGGGGGDPGGGAATTDDPPPLSWNRARDLRAVKRWLGVTSADADPATEIRCATTKRAIAVGYARVLLGDHGPYLELSRASVRWEHMRKVPAGEARFYDEWRVVVGDDDDDDDDGDGDDDDVDASSSSGGGAKLYDQLKSVRGQANPPKDNAWAVSCDRDVEEGYADYRVGMAYVGAFDVEVNRRGGDGGGAGGWRGMPRPRGSGRVAWWKPSKGIGAIVPDGRRGVRGGDGGGVVVRAEAVVDFGAAAAAAAAATKNAPPLLTPGEGVWFDVDAATGEAIHVTGPGCEPTRFACPGARDARDAASVKARARMRAAAAEKAGKTPPTPAEAAAARARIAPWDARAEAERRAIAAVARRCARILRENCAKIAAAATVDVSSSPAPKLPAWLAGVSRGSVVCPVAATLLAPPEIDGGLSAIAADVADAAAGVGPDRWGPRRVVAVSAARVEAFVAAFASASAADADAAKTVANARDALEKHVLGGGDDVPLVVILPHSSSSRRLTFRLPRGLILALRATPRVFAVILPSLGPETLLRELVALAGACARGTAAFVPCAMRAVVAGAGEDGTSTVAAAAASAASAWATATREGWGAAAGFDDGASGRAYCWACGDGGHVKSACPRREGGGGGGGRRETPGKVLKDRRSPRERGRMGTSVCPTARRAEEEDGDDVAAGVAALAL